MRKQLAVKILKTSFDKLEKIKEETGLSNAKIIEMLLENYDNTNTNISTNTSTNVNISNNTNTSITEERVAEMIQEALANINISTNTNTNISTNTSTSTNDNVNTSIDINTNTSTSSLFDHDFEEISEEERAEIAATCEWVDETPEWLQKQLDEQTKPTVIEPPVNDPNPPILKREEPKKESISKYR